MNAPLTFMTFRSEYSRAIMVGMYAMTLMYVQKDQQFRRYSKNCHDHMYPCCDRDLENWKPTFLHDTLAHNAALPYQVWYQDDMWFRRNQPDKHSLTFWTYAVTLTLNTVNQFLHRTLQLMIFYSHTKFGCKWTSSLEDMVEIVIFWLYKPSMWPQHWR